MRVIWGDEAKAELKAAINFIRQDSYQNSIKVLHGIVAKTKTLSAYPEAHSLDKYKQNNDGSYRAIEIYRYRIAFRILPDRIIIIRLRHTSMEPLFY